MKQSLEIGCVLAFVAASFVTNIATQAQAQDEDSLWTAETFEGLELRSLGPGFMSGRIADVAIHPEDENLWYVAVGSGGVWKTTNAGTTWANISDGYFDVGPVGSIDVADSDPNVGVRFLENIIENCFVDVVNHQPSVIQTDLVDDLHIHIEIVLLVLRYRNIRHSKIVEEVATFLGCRRV